MSKAVRNIYYYLIIIAYSFIYDFENSALSNKVFAQDGKMKEILFSRLDEFEDIDSSDNLLTRAKKSKD